MKVDHRAPWPDRPESLKRGEGARIVHRGKLLPPERREVLVHAWIKTPVSAAAMTHGNNICIICASYTFHLR